MLRAPHAPARGSPQAGRPVSLGEKQHLPGSAPPLPGWLGPGLCGWVTAPSAVPEGPEPGSARKGHSPAEGRRPWASSRVTGLSADLRQSTFPHVGLAGPAGSWWCLGTRSPGAGAALGCWGGAPRPSSRGRPRGWGRQAGSEAGAVACQLCLGSRSPWPLAPQGPSGAAGSAGGGGRSRGQPRRASWCHLPARLRRGDSTLALVSEGWRPRGAGFGLFLARRPPGAPAFTRTRAPEHKVCELRGVEAEPQGGTLSRLPVCWASLPGPRPPEAQDLDLVGVGA